MLVIENFQEAAVHWLFPAAGSGGVGRSEFGMMA
jgi:hypothetical protein